MGGRGYSGVPAFLLFACCAAFASTLQMPTDLHPPCSPRCCRLEQSSRGCSVMKRVASSLAGSAYAKAHDAGGSVHHIAGGQLGGVGWGGWHSAEPAHRSKQPVHRLYLISKHCSDASHPAEPSPCVSR